MTETDEPKYGDERDSIRDRAKAAGIRYTNAYAKDKDSDYPLLLLAFSDGTASSSISIDARSARFFSQLKFENFQIIGPYRSLYDKSDESIEAVLVSNSQQTDLVRTLLKLPGIERVSQENETSPYFEVTTETLDIPDVDSIEFTNGPVDVPHVPSWRLLITGAPNGMTVELSPPSDPNPRVVARHGSQMAIGAL